MLKILILFTTVACAVGAAVPQGLQTELEGRIVDGQPTSIKSFPYQISLQTRGFHMCGGTIISEQLVVTAAHCLLGQDSKYLQVRVGSSQWISGGVLVNVKAFIIHEKYFPLLTLNDIALIRLNSSLVFSSTIRPAKLATVSPKSGAMGVVSGWGTTKFLSNSSPTQLKYVEMDILTREECGSPTYNYGKFLISKGMICTYAKGKDSCQGDSGGPLVSGNELIGVVSWGNGCGFQGYPGVYTDVAHMHKWILNAAAKLENDP